MDIRKAEPGDKEGIWEIFSKVIETGNTYVYAPKTPKSDLEKLWLASNMHTFVVEENGRLLGTYFIKPNQIDLGSHIANAGFMVHPSAHGKGIGKKMCEHALVTASALGFYAMQFNMVVSTNKAAVHLWQKFGFEIIGTIPLGFQHQELGLVDGYIMYKKL